MTMDSTPDIEMLAATVKAKGTAGQGRPRKGGTISEPPATPTLAEVGVSKKESSRAERSIWNAFAAGLVP
jgi:hypothetical protein